MVIPDEPKAQDLYLSEGDLQEEEEEEEEEEEDGEEDEEAGNEGRKEGGASGSEEPEQKVPEEDAPIQPMARKGGASFMMSSVGDFDGMHNRYVAHVRYKRRCIRPERQGRRPNHSAAATIHQPPPVRIRTRVWTKPTASRLAR